MVAAVIYRGRAIVEGFCVTVWLSYRAMPAVLQVVTLRASRWGRGASMF